MRATAFLTGVMIVMAPSLVLAGDPSANDIIKSLRPSGAISGVSRGIRPVGEAPAPAPSQARPVSTGAASAPSQSTPHANQAAAPTKAPSVNLAVQFASGSADLTPAAIKTLTELGRALSSNELSNFRFRIEGHTDTVGSPETNRALSEQRAQAVVDYMATNFNIDRGRMQAVGMGSDDLAVQTGPQVAEARNRRVQIINLGDMNAAK